MYIMGIGCAMYLQYYSQYYCGAINNLDILLFDMYVMVYGLYQNYYTISTYNSHMHAVLENSKICNFSTLNSCTSSIYLYCIFYKSCTFRKINTNSIPLFIYTRLKTNKLIEQTVFIFRSECLK